MLDALLKLEGLSAKDKPPRGQFIITSMTGSANFQAPNPPPNPPLATVQGLVDDASAAVLGYETALSVLRQKLVERNNALSLMENGLLTLASYVGNVAAGNEDIILSAGMYVASPRSRPQPMGAPENLRTETTKSDHAVQLAWNPVPRAKSYLLDQAADYAGPYTQVAAPTASRTLVEGLTPGTRYFFRVRAVGPLGIGPYSEVVSRIAN